MTDQRQAPRDDDPIDPVEIDETLEDEGDVAHDEGPDEVAELDIEEDPEADAP